MDNLYTKRECDLIANNISYLAGKKGWGIEQLARESKVCASTISQFIKRRKNIKICTLSKLAKAVGVDMETLLTRQY